tara:strand:+ start:320 stop:1801 length:1482 start_codon:yes stop_codon:yes gene_type:complete
MSSITRCFYLNHKKINRLKQLSKDSIIYGLGGILAKSVSFFTLPIYTRIFSTAEYGTIEMLAVISSFIGAILVMGMDSAQSMFFFKYKEDGKKEQARMVTAVLQWKLIVGSVIVIIATIFGPILNAILFEGKLGLEYFAIAFVSVLFNQVFSQSVEVMRLLYKPWKYIVLTIAQSIGAALLILLFILVYSKGILGFFLGSACASMIIAVIGWYQARDYLTLSKLQLDWWPRLVRFGAPLVPAGIAFYFMSTADRWFVQYYHGPTELGLFAVGAKFSMLMGLVVETFRKAWWPIAMDAMHSKDGPETFRMIARLYMGVGSASVVILTFFSPWLLVWFTDEKFHDAWQIVGILSLQAVLYGFFLIVSAGIWKEEKTFINLYCMSGSAVIGIGLNFLLVPPFGGVGAAIATVITYVIWVVSTMIISEYFWRVEFPWRLLLVQITCSLIFVFWHVSNGSIQNTFWSLCCFILLVFSLLFSSLETANFRQLKRLLKKP